jgi:hypothetical protein
MALVGTLVGLLLARRCAAGFGSAVGQFLGVSGRCRQDMRLYEHVFWYRLLVLRWAHFGAPGAAYALQGPRAVTCRPFTALRGAIWG